ncbi:MAG: DUF484 family protein, partial [Pseudomonadota bacterium]
MSVDNKNHDLKAKILADPNLVLEDDTVMRALIDAKADQGGRKVVDLRGALVSRLEDRLDRLENTHRSVIAAAYENLAGTSQIHKAVLMILEQPRFVDFLRVLTLETPEMVAVDFARLCIETDEAEPGPVKGLDADLADSMIVVPPGGVDAYLELGGGGVRKVALRQAAPEADAVFGDDARWVRSEALVRLDLGDERQGLLVFGAEDPHRFGPEHGVDLLTFFGGVVERQLRHWLSPGL